MACRPASSARRRLSASLVSTSTRTPGSRAAYQAAATRIARSLRSLGPSPAFAVMYVSLKVSAHLRIHRSKPRICGDVRLPENECSLGNPPFSNSPAFAVMYVSREWVLKQSDSTLI